MDKKDAGSEVRLPNAGNLLRDVLADPALLNRLIASGDKQPISAQQVEQVIPPERLAELGAANGIPAPLVSTVVAQLLPHAVNAADPT